MNVLRVHNRYLGRGGEDVSFESDVQLLRDHGVDVRTLVVSNDAIPDERSAITSAKLAIGTIWSLSGLRAVEREILDFRPDVAHFDNTFPLISPSAYTACRRHGVPVVQTLHNYRPLCPNVLFYNDGRVCEECMGHLFQYPAVIHGCYRGSRAQTAVVTAMNAVHRLRGTWQRDVDRYIVMTRFERDKFIAGGFPADKIVVKPHFVYAEPVDPGQPRSGLLYVGRLTREKGIPMLLDAWASGAAMPITIAGDGPLAEEVRAAAERFPELRYLGQQPYAEVLARMRRASLLIVTSEWYETFGRVVIESFAGGTPVLAAKIGAIGELVTPGITGLHFEPGNAEDLAAKIRWAAEHPDEMRRMGENARREYDEKYTPERNYTMLMDIYERVIAESAGRRAEPGIPAPTSA